MDQYHTINQIKQCGFSLAADIHCEEVQGRQMLIDITNGRFYETNSIGKKVFDYLKNKNDTKKIYEEFSKIPGFLESDLDDFLIELYKSKVIKINV